MKPFRSSQGTDALISRVCELRERELLAQHLSPLFPELLPWSECASVPIKHATNLAHQLKAVALGVAQFRDSLTVTAGQLARYLDADEATVRDIALRFANRRTPGMTKLTWAQQLLRMPIPGTTNAAHMTENLGAASISFTADELRQLNAAVAAIRIQGDRLPPAVAVMSGAEAPPKR